jgi:hypothetical protein
MITREELAEKMNADAVERVGSRIRIDTVWLAAADIAIAALGQPPSALPLDIEELAKELWEVAKLNSEAREKWNTVEDSMYQGRFRALARHLLLKYAVPPQPAPLQDVEGLAKELWELNAAYGDRWQNDNMYCKQARHLLAKYGVPPVGDAPAAPARFPRTQALLDRKLHSEYAIDIIECLVGELRDGGV